jgi:predicted DNA-binding protein
MAQTPNMKQTSLFLRLEQFGKLAELSRITGAPVAELIRRAIDTYLEQRKREFGRG